MNSIENMNMKALANKPKEVTLFIKLLYLEVVLGFLAVYAEYDPFAESMYIFLFVGFGFVVLAYKVINDFSNGDRGAYDNIKSGSYFIIASFFIITLLIADESSIPEYLKKHTYFIAFPLVGILNIIWLNFKTVKDWFEKQ